MTNTERNLYHNQDMNFDSQHLVEYEYEKECAELTIEQKLARKQLIEKALEDLNSEMESDSMNPEEIHEAILTRTSIQRELKILNKYLPE